MSARRVYGNKSASWTSEEYYRRLADYCLPKGGKIRQGVMIVVRYLETHPERLHMKSGVLVYSALRDAFPCK